MSNGALPARLQARLAIDYGGFAVDVDLSLPARGVTALFGPSGCGKTTILRCLAGLEPQATGRVALGPEVWHDSATRVWVAPHRRPVGMVFQDARLFAHLDVQANLHYGMRRVPREQQRLAFDDIVGLLGIGHLLQRRPQRLSGGEAQRVAIARALLCSPRLLLLDEPLAALDESRKIELLPYLERLHDELAIPVVYVSHARHEVARLADHLVLLEQGRVLADGPIHELTARLDLGLAQQDEAAVVVRARVAEHDAADGLTRLVPTDAAGKGLDLWVAHLDQPVGRPVRVEIAARDVSLALQPPQHSSILNALPAVVLARTDDDHGRSLIQLDAGGLRLLSRVTRRSANALQLGPGRAVVAQVKGVAVLA